MATELTEQHAGETRYDWRRWSNGNLWKLDSSDLGCPSPIIDPDTIARLRAAAANHARRHLPGQRFTIRSSGPRAVTIQLVTVDGG